MFLEFQEAIQDVVHPKQFSSVIVLHYNFEIFNRIGVKAQIPEDHAWGGLHLDLDLKPEVKKLTQA